MQFHQLCPMVIMILLLLQLIWVFPKKEITITADVKTKVYGESDPELTYQITSGSLESGDVLSGGLNRASGENIGDYAISSTVSNDNYEITFVSNALRIIKREITIRADAKIKLYGEEDPELTYTIINGSLEAGDVLTGGLSRVLGESVGDYTISSSLTNSNYVITFISANLRITAKKGIIITADVKTKIYGESDPELTYTITTGSIEPGDVLTGGLTRLIGEVVGEYTISSTLSNNNYDITFVSNNLSITKKLITVTADSKSKIYGEVDPELTYLITAGNLETGDVLNGVLTRVSGESTGDYIISSTLSNDNYDITFVSNNLSITKKLITVTTDSKSKIYGEIDPELTYLITTGSLETGDVLNGALTRVSGESVGDYIISSTLSNDNYVITFVSNNLSITKKKITVTADSKSKIYGEVDPELTYQITTGSIESEDVLTGGLSRTSGEDVGAYAISSTIANDNYEITFVAANLSITKKELTITADAKTKVYGESDPELTYSITTGSLLDGDVFTGGLTREVGEEVGYYLIKMNSLTLGNNYEIIFIEANFEITIVLDIDDVILNNQITLYPNPAKDILHIKFNNSLIINKVIIYNLLGKEIIEEKNIENSIDLEKLARGHYILKIITNKGYLVKRFLKL